MRPRVLLVLESPGESAALVDALAHHGFEATAVPRARDALRRLSGPRRPEAVVVDSALSDVDGSAAARAMKDLLPDEFLPILLLCGGGVDARVRGLLDGADDAVAAPCATSELAARLTALLRITAREDGLRLANAELERLSITDPLTGLFNRRYFRYRLEQELERSRRHGAPVALMLLDLDHFKRVNDLYGHGAGDVALRALADLLGRELRRVDVCARWGGEEFAVLLPDTDQRGAAVVAERVLRAVRTHLRFSAPPVHGPARRLEHFRVTASAGVAVHASAGTADADALLAAADAALYGAKSEGRDRACFAYEAPVDAPTSDLERAACA